MRRGIFSTRISWRFQRFLAEVGLQSSIWFLTVERKTTGATFMIGQFRPRTGSSYQEQTSRVCVQPYMTFHQRASYRRLIGL